jgi:flagellar hook protein FlgE
VIAPDATQSATLVNFTIESTGRVLMQLSDGNTIPVAYLAMNNFSNPEGLIARGKTMFEASAASGKLYNGFKGPGTDGMGLMRAGYLELSNVDLASEFTDMIRSQRGLQANARTITTSDEILQELIQLKR